MPGQHATSRKQPGTGTGLGKTPSLDTAGPQLGASNVQPGILLPGVLQPGVLQLVVPGNCMPGGCRAWRSVAPFPATASARIASLRSTPRASGTRRRIQIHFPVLPAQPYLAARSQLPCGSPLKPSPRRRQHAIRRRSAKNPKPESDVPQPWRPVTGGASPKPACSARRHPQIGRSDRPARASSCWSASCFIVSYFGA